MNDIYDLETLEAPITLDNPCGTDPRIDYSLNSKYLKLKDDRSEARKIERQIDMDGEGPSPLSFWSTALETGQEILANEAKDIEVAAWVAEASLRVHGLAGFSQSLLLGANLIDRYWDEIFPLPEDDDPDVRIAPFAGLNGLNDDSPVIQCIRRVSLVEASGPYSLWEYQKALELENILDQSVKEERIGSGEITLDEFTQAVSSTSTEFYRDLIDSIHSVRENLDRLYNAYYQRVGADAPPAGGIRQALEEIEETLNIVARNKIDAFEAGDDGSDSSLSNQKQEKFYEASEATQSKIISGREDALSQLLSIAKFFRKHEPHSPISYVLEELVRRGRMSLPELLEELISDDEARRMFALSSGMRVQRSEPDSYENTEE